MNIKGSRSFSVIVEGKKRGNATPYWSKKIISVQSHWSQGSEQEKFEVLLALRKIYNPEERADIRGITHQTPSQIAQSEGFTVLQYSDTEAPLAITIIVKAKAAYSRILPFDNNLPKAPLLHEGVTELKSVHVANH
ncbi:MAG: hypothetical protein JWM78_1041 [Verrucomicrobiaceae bacterium]|nr:hypothetical protein [Verrucomicrobiaceae bacterium]